MAAASKVLVVVIILPANGEELYIPLAFAVYKVAPAINLNDPVPEIAKPFIFTLPLSTNDFPKLITKSTFIFTESTALIVTLLVAEGNAVALV